MHIDLSEIKHISLSNCTESFIHLKKLMYCFNKIAFKCFKCFTFTLLLERRRKSMFMANFHTPAYTFIILNLMCYKYIQLLRNTVTFIIEIT